MKRPTKYLCWATSLGFAVTAILLSLFTPTRMALAQQPGNTATAPAGNVENGRQAFKKFGCFSCHGYSGEGGAGARLAQNPITFPAFRQYVRRPSRTMPPFGTQISDAELADIYAFIKSIPPSPPPKSIPLLNE